MPFDNTDDPRRRILIKALAAGAFAAGIPPFGLAASVLGAVPGQMASGRSIYRLSGDVRVNNAPATLDTRIKPGDTVETGSGAEIVFVVGKDSYILRGNSRMTLQAESTAPDVASTLKLFAGKMLAVFGRSTHRIQTATAVVGIRGTGVYSETDPEQTYFCTCYGIADIASDKDRNSTETVEATHHDKPLYILAKGSEGKLIRPAPFLNHTDQELQLIESLVGRTPPFIFPGDAYSAPRRKY